MRARARRDVDNINHIEELARGIERDARDLRNSAKPSLASFKERLLSKLADEGKLRTD